MDVGIGREVADAYVDVHGDLSKFRKSMQANKGDMEKLGDDYGKEFSDALNKRLEKDKDDKWNSVLDAFHQDSVDGWKRAFSDFDTSDIDRGNQKLLEFMRQMEESGAVSRSQLVKVEQASTSALNKLKEHEAALNDNTSAGRRYSESIVDIERKGRLGNVLTKLRNMVTVTKAAVPEIEKASSGTSRWSKMTSALGSAWKNLDDDVRLVLMAIAAGAGPLSAGISGLSAAVTAVAGSLGSALLSAVPLASAFSGLAIGVGLAVTGFENMVKRFPGIKAELNGIGAVWKAQADRFGTAWGPAFESLLASFKKQLGSVDFGTPLGKAFAGISKAFEGVVNGSGFRAFLKALTGDIPAAVQGLGTGFAGVFDWLMNMLAAAAPVAKMLGEDFAKWGTELGKVAEKARESGALTETFEKARESLLAVLDLAGSLGSALGTLFDAGTESGNRMLRGLTDLIDQWNAWMNTAAGQNWLEQWFADGERIIKSFGPLLVGVAEMFDKLVTPYAISQFESLMSSLGELLPILGDILNVLSNLGVFNILVEALVAVGTALQPAIPALSDLATILGQGVTGAIQAVTPLLQSVVTFLTPIIEAITQVAAAAVPMLVQGFQRISEAIAPLLDSLAPVVSYLMDQLVPVLTDVLGAAIEAAVGFIEGLATAFSGVVEIIRGIMEGDWAMIWEGVKNVVSGVLTALGSIIGGALNIISALWNGIWSAMGNFIGIVWDGISNLVSTAILFISTFISTTMNAISAAWTVVWNSVKAVASAVWEALKNVVTVALNSIKAFITGTINGIKATWSAVWNAIKTAFTNVVNGIKNVATTVFNSIKSFITTAVNNIKSTITNIMNATKATWSSIFNSIKTTATNIFNSIKSFISNTVNSIKSTISNVFNAIKSTISNILNSAKSTVSSIWNSIKSTFSNALSAVKTTVSNGFNRIKESVRNGITAAVNYVRELPSKARNALSNIGSTLYNAGRNLLQGMINGVKSMAGRIASSAMEAVGNAVNKVKGFLGINSPSKLFRSYGQFMGQGMALGQDDEARSVENASLNLGKAAMLGIDRADMFGAGKTAAEKLADGLKANEGLVDDAFKSLGGLTLPASSLVVSSRHNPQSGAEAAAAGGGGNVFNEGAIQVVTPAQDGRVVASQLMDEFTRAVGG